MQDIIGRNYKRQCLFVTYIPSFYKVTLLNLLSEFFPDLHVLYLSRGSAIRSDEFFLEKEKFRFDVVHSVPFEGVRGWKGVLSAIKLNWRANAKVVILPGWDRLEFWAILISSRKSKKVLVLESTIEESTVHGIKGVLKRLFLKYIDCVIASGDSHKTLLRELGFSGEVKISNGVGMLDEVFVAKRSAEASSEIEPSFKNLVFVGRLSKEKNVPLLIEAVKRFERLSLTIVGTGPLEESLTAQASGFPNIRFVGTKNRREVSELLESMDALILPSERETWGLVVEEALAKGLPVIVSKTSGISCFACDTLGAGIKVDATVEGICSGLAQMSDVGKFRQLKTYALAYNQRSKDLDYLNVFRNVIDDE